MRAIDAGLASRLEVWVDPAGHSSDDVARTLRAVLQAGFAPGRVGVVVDDAAVEDPQLEAPRRRRQ